MPFINGKFYSNPAYGRALEEARQADASAESQGQHHQTAGEHWVTIDHQHVLIHESDGPHSVRVRSEIERKVEEGYGETAGLLPARKPRARGSVYDRNTWDSDSARSLQQARTNIMDISIRNDTVRRSRPRDAHDPIQQSIWKDNVSAASQSRGSMAGNYFFIRQRGTGPRHPPKRAGFGQGKPTREYGPFRNVGGGDVPSGDQTHIDIYEK